MTVPVNLTGVPIPYPRAFIDSLNGTQLNYVRAHCNTTVCSLSYAQVHYDPSLAGNELYLALFAIIIILQTVFGIWRRTWAYLCTMIPGLLLEILGYNARVSMSRNPWLSNPFLIYIVCLTIAPVFFTAAIYVSFMRCLPLYDPSLTLNRLRPRNYIIIFVCFDVFSLVLQSIGGGIADTANSKSGQDDGVNLMVAGLAVQVVSLFIFGGLAVDFAYRVKKLLPQDRRAPVTASWKMKGFVCSIAVATVAIIIRSIFRCAELSGGFDGSLANNQSSFMVLEGGMMTIALIAMTSFHPGFCVGDAWFAKSAKGGHQRIDNGLEGGTLGYNGGYGANEASTYELGANGKTRR